MKQKYHDFVGRFVSPERIFWFLFVILFVWYFGPLKDAGWFYMDDSEVFLRNRDVLRFDLYGIFTNFTAKNYMPLTVLGFSLEKLLFGMNPAISHLISVVLHLFNVVLLRILLARMGVLNKGLLFFILLVFAFHLTAIEPVSWLSARGDLLALSFMILSLWCYSHYLEKGQALWIGLCFVFFVFGSLAQARFLLFFGVLLGMDVFYTRIFNVRAFWEKIPFLLGGILMGVVYSHSREIGHRELWENQQLLEMITRPFSVLVNFCLFFLFPPRPSHFHTNLQLGIGLTGLFSLALMVAASIYSWIKEKHKALGILIMWASVTLPMLKILPFDYQSLIGERYLYCQLPFLLCLLMICFRHLIYKNPRISVWKMSHQHLLLTFLLLSIYGPPLMLGKTRVRSWISSESLLKDDLANNAYNGVVRFRLADLYAHQEKWEKARVQAEILESFVQRSPRLYVLLGLYHVRKGNLEKALSYLEKARDLKSRDEMVSFLEATIQFHQGDPAKALKTLEKVGSRNPVLIHSRNLLIRSVGDFNNSRWLDDQAKKAATLELSQGFLSHRFPW